MKITFNSVDDFIGEIQEAVDCELTPVVRYFVNASSSNDGDGYEVYLYVTFISDDGLVCELELFCGRDMNLPNNPKFDLGTIASEEHVSRIKRYCKEAGVPFKSGRYEQD